MRSLPFSLSLISLFFFIASFSVAAAAEKRALDMQNGDRLNGEGVRLDRGRLSWRTSYGDIVRLPLDEIQSLQMSEAWDLRLSDNHTVRGPWSIDAGTVTVHSSVVGVVHCPIAQLLSGEPAAIATEAPSIPIPQTGAPAATLPSIEEAPSPENDAPPSSLQTMLRLSSILLRPGEWSVSTGFDYTHDRALYSSTDTRSAVATVQLQRGFTPRIEGSVLWRGGWTNSTVLSSPAGPSAPVTTSSTSTFRYADPEFGASMLLFGEGRTRPEAIAVAGLTVPVNDPDEGGLFRTRVGLEFLKTSDPGALFLGFGWLHDDRGWTPSPYRPLNRFYYHLGAAIGLNDELAIGFQARGEYRPELEARDGTLLVISQEPVHGRFWFNLRLSQRSFLEMAVLLPMNDDAHAASFGFTYIQRY